MRSQWGRYNLSRSITLGVTRYRVLQKKQPSTKKFQHPPEAPRPPVSMLLTIASQWPEQESVFFWRLRQALLSHNIEIGGPGVSNSPRHTSSWLALFLKNPVSRNNTHKITWTSCVPISQQSLRFGQSDKMPTSAGDWWKNWHKITLQNGQRRPSKAIVFSVPSGNLTYGKPPFLISKSTDGPCSIAMWVITKGQLVVKMRKPRNPHYEALRETSSCPEDPCWHSCGRLL